MSFFDQIDRNRVPHHVAIIMDGNGRWAMQRGMARTMGHQAGAQKAHEVMETAVKLGVDYLTLYTFSTENWNRPSDEVAALMALLLQHLEEELFMKNNARFRAVGDLKRLPQNVQDAVQHLTERTAKNTGTCMVLALSYSSKWEITEAIRHIAEEAKNGTLNPEEINEHTLDAYLATNFMPDPELLIRTGGEQRLSNYLLWQSAYSEFYFTPTFWPDFGEEAFAEAICDFQHRQRRFGKTEAQIEQENKKKNTYI